MWWRRLLLRLALGSHTYDYMRQSLRSDPRTRTARLVDIVVRKDAVERRVEADWCKTIARIIDGAPRFSVPKAELLTSPIQNCAAGSPEKS